MPPCNTPTVSSVRAAHVTISLLWQYKLRAVITWLNDTVFDVMETLRRGIREMDKDMSASLRKRSLTKMLRKKSHPSTVVKYFLGKMYNNTVYKLLKHKATHNDPHVFVLIKNIHQDKSLHHFISYIMNQNNEEFQTRMLGNIQRAIATHFGISREVDEPSKRLFEKYLKVLRKICGRDGNGAMPIDWYMFRDTFSMAANFKISVNLTKVDSMYALRELHDRFSAYTQRDGVALMFAEKQRRVFLSFVHPEKEYSGFTFDFLSTVENLIDEGREMKHCVGGYGPQCSEGHSLIFSMRKNGISYITIDIAGYDSKCPIAQMYTRHDVRVVNPDILKVVETWRQDLAKMHMNDECSYQDMNALINKFIANSHLLNDNNLPNGMLDVLLKERTELLEKLEYLNLLDYAKTTITAQKANTDVDKKAVEFIPAPAIGHNAVCEAVQANINDLITELHSRLEVANG
jgi:hypothetical protein